MMESTKRRITEESNLRGIPGDFQRLSRDGAATAAELRDFVKHLHDKSPQDVMGEVAQSGLAQAMGIATVGIAAVLVVFTIVPYLFKGTEAVAAKEKEQPAAAATAEDTTSTTPEVADTAETSTADAGTPDLKRASKALGIDETKDADAKSNPLEKNLDTLLDGID